MHNTNHHKYLKSAQWKRTREEHINNHPKCYVCGSNHNIDVYHKTHDRLGTELNTDLVSLCGFHFNVLNAMISDKGWDPQEAHVILKKRHEKRGIPKRYSEKFKSGQKRSEVLNTKITQKTKKVIYDMLIESDNITRQELYNKASNKLGCKKRQEIKHVVWEMLKRNQIIVLNKPMQLFCINKNALFNH